MSRKIVKILTSWYHKVSSACTIKLKLNTGIIFKDDPLITSRNASHEKEVNVLKVQLTTVTEELTAAKLNIEIIIKELNEAKTTILEKENTFKGNWIKYKTNPQQVQPYRDLPRQTVYRQYRIWYLSKASQWTGWRSLSKRLWIA